MISSPTFVKFRNFVIIDLKSNINGTSNVSGPLYPFSSPFLLGDLVDANPVTASISFIILHKTESLDLIINKTFSTGVPQPIALPLDQESFWASVNNVIIG